MSTMRIISVSLLAVALCLAVGEAAALQVDWYSEPASDEELNRSVTYRDLQVKNTGRELFYLSYYHNAIMDDGTVIYSQFFIHNLGPGSNHPGADLTIIEPNGAVHRMGDTFNKLKVECAEDRLRISFGGFLLEGDPQARPAVYHVRSRFGNDLGVDLTYTCEAPPFLDKGIYFNGNKNDYQRWVTYCPRGAVEGTVTVDGETRRVRGRGFADHAVTNPTFASGKLSIVSMGIFIRGSTPDFGFSLMEYRPMGGGGGISMPGILVNIGNKNVLFTRDYGLEIKGWVTREKRTFPTVFRLRINKPPLVMDGEIRMTRYLLSESMLGRIKSRLVRFLLSKIIGDSWWARFVSSWKVRGVYKGKEFTRQGTAVTQTMFYSRVSIPSGVGKRRGGGF